MNESSKLVQKDSKPRHDSVEKVIHRELCKKLKFDHLTKWFVHKPESVMKNEIHKILRDFDIRTDPLISTRRPDLGIDNKEKKNEKITGRRMSFLVLANRRMKIKMK